MQPEDPRRLWQNQPAPVLAETLERMIQRQARQIQAQTRQAVLRSLAMPALAVGVSGFVVKFSNDVLPRAACAIAVLWSLAGQYRLHRAVSPTGEVSGTGLDSYRREVRRHQALAEGQLLWTLAPAALALAVLVTLLIRFGLDNGLLGKMAPFLTLLTVWVVGIFVVRLRDQRTLQREIDQLDELERGNRV